MRFELMRPESRQFSKLLR